MKKVIVFGGGGFVGSRLCPILDTKCKLTVVDTFWFWNNSVEFIEKTGIKYASVITDDIRNVDLQSLLYDKDIVINLACLSNDTSSDVNYKLTHDISYNGVMNLINMFINSSAKKFIQTSTTSVYGVKQGNTVNETEIPEPITQYSKIKAEIDNVLLYYMKYKSKPITILRPATLYGYSPRLRLDVMVNSLLDRAIQDNKLLIEGGKQFRPCLHVDDLCYTYVKCIDNEISNNKIYNVTNENYSVNQIVHLIKQVLPNVELHYQHVIDQRSYKTNSHRVVNDLKILFNKNLVSSIPELYEKIKTGSYNRDKSINMLVIRDLIKSGRLS